MTITEGLFHSPQTLNGHVKKGTGSLIQHPGAATVKWSQIGAALTLLSNTPSLLILGLITKPNSPLHSCSGLIGVRIGLFRGDVKIPTYKPHTNHKICELKTFSLYFRWKN